MGAVRYYYRARVAGQYGIDSGKGQYRSISRFSSVAQRISAVSPKSQMLCTLRMTALLGMANVGQTTFKIFTPSFGTLNRLKIRIISKKNDHGGNDCVKS